MKNWKNKTDCWPIALAMMVSVLTAIAFIDICVSWHGIGVFARMFG